MSEYRLIERVIEYVERGSRHGAALVEIAAGLGESESRLRESFVSWAGIDPERFLELTDQRTLSRMIGTEGSSPSLTGATGGLDIAVFSERDLGKPITTEIVESRFGDCLVASLGERLCSLDFIEAGVAGLGEAFERLRRQWPESPTEQIEQIKRGNDGLRERTARLLAGENAEGAILLRGTPFQRRVWQALMTIPSGRVTTYQAIAESIGAPSSSRAVGTAIGKNSLAIVIPCHRVIRKNGDRSGYRWGSPRKRAMLGWEIAGEYRSR